MDDSHSVNNELTSWQKSIVSADFINADFFLPMSHAATIAQTPAGLVAAWFSGKRERSEGVSVYLSRLVNHQWTHPKLVADGVINETLRYPSWNPVLFQRPGKELLLFYKVGLNPASWQGFLKRSTDSGLTWSSAQSLPQGGIGPVKNKPFLFQEDLLLCPSSTEHNSWCLRLEWFDMATDTWQVIMPFDASVEAIQPSLLSHPNRRLQLVCRSRYGSILTAWSEDGVHWSKLENTTLPGNNSGLDALTLMDGRQLMVYNHLSTKPGHPLNTARNSLNVALSEDGIDWFAAAVLEHSSTGEYSYPSVIQNQDGLIHVVYSWHKQRIKHVVLDPNQLKYQAIINGNWPY